MEKGYKRLTPEQPVGLRHAGYVISVQKVIKVRINWEILHLFLCMPTSVLMIFTLDRLLYY